MDSNVEAFPLDRVRYLSPPQLRNAHGEVRKVGVEVEFAGLELARAAEVMASVFGTSAEVDLGRLQAECSSPWGTMRLEVDATQLRDKTYLEPLRSLGIPNSSATSHFIDDTVRSVATQIVPTEVVTPPVPWNELHELDPLWNALRDAGAKGTNDSVLNAFGLHLNPEIAAPENVGHVLGTVQAYLLLEDWLMRALDIDASRQVAPFIRSFPEPYRRLVLSQGYRPDWDQFVEDYAQYNPTRNRRVDLWPLIRHVTGDTHEHRVRDWKLVKARPTYHYRLANCEINQPGWTPAEACNGWVMVERLAAADETRFELAAAYLERGDLPLRLQTLGWVPEVEARLHRLAGPEDARAAR